jgi:hypothetical protein
VFLSGIDVWIVFCLIYALLDKQAVGLEIINFLVFTVGSA